MNSLFSKRNATPPAELHYDIPEQVRSRILAIFQDHCGDPRGAQGGFEGLLAEVGKRLFKEYGDLRAPGYVAARRSDNPVVEHFFSCETDEAGDFIEACFQSSVYRGGQRGVDEINSVFREDGIGFELSAFVEHHVEKEEPRFGQIRKRTYIEREYPRLIRRDEQYVHEQVVAPALKLLTHSKFRVANSEILKAHSDHRTGRHEDAITACSSAFESVLKTICDLKGWSYNVDKDTCATLVDICYNQGLFPSFYVDLFKRVGTIRNKLGDAHGRGPTPIHDVDDAHAEHMLYMTSVHIILLCKLAGLE